MSSGFLSNIKQIFQGSVPTKKECRFCGGGRCMGMCGGGLAKLQQTTIQGVLHVANEHEAVVKKDEAVILTFDPSSSFRRIVMKKCQPDAMCQIEALVSGIKMEKLISAKKIN